MMRTPLRRLGLVVLLALSALAVTSCKKDQSTTGETAQESASGFAKGFNALIDRPQGLIKTYFDAIPEEGPAPDSKPRLFPEQNFATRSIEEAKQAFAAAKSSVPDSMKAIPPLADAALAAATKLLAAYTAAQKYYEAEDYKDDKFAKGKELHTQMIAARGEFRAAIAALEQAIDAVENVQAEAEIKKHAKDTPGYWYRWYNMTSKKLVTSLTAAPDLATALKAAADGFPPVDEAHTGLEAYAGKQGDKMHAAFKSYVGMAATFHSNAKKLQRMGSEKVDDQQVANAIDLLIGNYNNMVQMATSLSQLEDQDLLK